MRTLAVVTLCLCTGMARAEAPLSAEAFDALTLGRTMTWAEFGQVYGVEQYLPDRRVRWTVLGDDCKTGHWYAEGPAICFLYDDRLDPVCWEITQSGTGLLARHTASPPDAAPVVIVETSEPMACFGPEVGA
ncbi:hypothetical protein EI545_02640 [Tabrizicola piscis]|uniref:DUF995 domain-containing protein n=1 Tax=Tabrizicola piscis TaxID=2494374 RepID=A0A3S8U2J5_9RHOB|nr:hypothetical protein [Tabrizicola piscis]AZL57831.1 hypothetical protein EI545_02640 [Tabrizicola piscis]